MSTEITTPGAWREALESYLAWMRAANAPDTTIYLRSYHLRRFASETGQPPFSFTLEGLVAYIGSQPTWSASSKRSMRTSLRAFYGWAHLVGRIADDPSRRMPTIKVPIGRPRPAPMSAIESAKRDHDWRVRLMIQLAAYAGLRSCEVAVVHSNDLVEDLLGWSLIVHGKGNKIRVVPLRDEVAHLMRQCPDGYLFPGQIDGHLSAAYVSKMMSYALPEGITGHMLRHWFASRAYTASGNDIRAVQELLGHASVATTQIYTAVEDSSLRRAVNGI